ncbi:hypothetical protein OG331_50645 [Streptomyces sp. NBC_01017]|uniref:hypothetical protein n=1 Tax=Streptomyces sp. NBC_01017 TaxID=2903721 RepID=UPI003869DEBD|nr:hypothetical protein OG331_01330 [Streptomyces sp. NBC_01017]WSV35197.1 hypothetical protein OG331_50645 [Streptomyces sp. NBC_01017]
MTDCDCQYRDRRNAESECIARAVEELYRQDAAGHAVRRREEGFVPQRMEGCHGCG